MRLNRRLPSLNALRTFEAAARHGSFKAAADELCVSQSAVSHQIKLLQADLGVELFVRKLNGVELTRQGRAYFPILRDAFERIAAGTELLRGAPGRPTLTLQVYSTFAIRWLIPRLPVFQRAHPEVNVRLHTSQSDVNFEYDDVDACVLIGNRTAAGLCYDFLFSSRVFPVCSPATLAEHRLQDDPARLRAATLLQVYPSRTDWWTWLNANGVEGVSPEGGQQFDSYELAMNAAVQGLGVALGMEPFVARDLRSGSLLEPFPGRRTYTTGDWHFVCRDEKKSRADITAFREWIVQQSAADPDMPPPRPR
jgi:LysR family transcriptional regulator, glycine cleavage system transcriptional activator